MINMRNYATREEWLAARATAGVGASELATACGANPYQSQLSLWQKKTGDVWPEETNENMERGHRLEPVVRDRFMDQWGWLFELKYDEFGMYFNTDYPHMFSTLDGVLVARQDAENVIIGQDVIEVKQGEEIILEIKNPAPKKESVYREWDLGIPELYKHQVAGQMMCSGIHRHIFLVNITGEFQQGAIDERVTYSEWKDYPEIIDEIAKTIPLFWQMVEDKTIPPQGIDLTQTAFAVQPINKDPVVANFDELEKAVRFNSMRYKGLQFTDKEMTSAKKTRAELNKAIDQIEEQRKSVKKELLKPFEAFEKRVLDIEGLIKEVKDPIDGQVKDYEERTKQQKKDDITALIRELTAGPYKDLKILLEQNAKNSAPDATILGVKNNPKWLNTTFTMTAIQKEILDWCETVRKEYATLYGLKDSWDAAMWEAIYNEYITTGLSIARALSKRQQIQDARDAARRMAEEAAARAAEEKARQEEAARAAATARPVHAPAAAPAAPTAPEEEPEEENTPEDNEKVCEPLPEKKIYTKCVEFSHTEIAEFNALIQYLIAHGFKCVEITNYSKEKKA